MQHDLNLVVDALPGLVWTARGDGQIDFVNQRWREYIAAGAEPTNDSAWRSAIHPDEWPAFQQRWEAALASGQPAEAEARLRRHDGDYRWFLLRISPILELSGRIERWCGIGTDIEDRKQTEDALRVQENHFRMIVEGLPVNITVRTPDGNLAFANRRTLAFHGVTFDEMKAWPIGHSFHPNDRQNGLGARKAALASGDPYHFEVRNRRADGVYRWFDMRGIPLRDSAGHLVLWYLLHIDIDERKRAETVLAGEKRILEMIASGRSLPIILDAIGRLVEDTVDDCFCRVVLADPAGTHAGHEADPGPPDAASEPGLAWSKPITSTAGKILGTLLVSFMQRAKPSSRHQALLDQISHIASIVISRAQSDAALQRSEAFLAETRRLSLTGGFSKRVATGEIIWSEEVYEIFGFDPSVPVTIEQIVSRVHPEDIHSFEEMLDRQRRGVNYEHDYRLLMPDQSVKYLHVVANATKDQDGGLEYIAAVQDVTQRRLSEEALAKARSELAHVARVSSLGAMTASIAHEVNQPLSGIITNASTCLRMLAANPPNVDGARETARRTIRDGHRASEVIKRLRALFSKTDAAIEPVDLNEAAQEVVALSLSELQRSRVILRQEFSGDVTPVLGDRVQLQQVILNLLLNAADAMSGVDDRPRRLVIRTERDENDHIRLSVRDSGSGFNPPDIDRLFDAFYTTKTGGMGIGLSVSRSIIENHLGRIWATANDGPGATFSFSVPRQSEETTPGGRVGAWATGITDKGRDTGIP